MNRGDVHRVNVPRLERGGKPGYYVIVSRDLIAQMPQMSTVMCAPVYTTRLGLDTEVYVGTDVGVSHPSSIRCDMVSLLLKEQLGRKVGRLTAVQLTDLRRALLVAFELS